MTGETIAGRYRIERRLGVGGMSTVQLAFDERLERYVAVKLLAEHLAEDETFVSRFKREALAAARLVHPNVVQVFDFGFDETLHRHYIVMEQVQGQSVAQILRDRGYLEVPEAVDILTQACRGLDYAHRNGVVHRDVKPGNLLQQTDGGVLKLADFGIAKAAEESSITKAGSVLGTAAYLAPEQARGEGAGPRTDLYALGVVAYQMLAGRLPYEAKTLSELALLQQREVPPTLDTLNREVTPALGLAVAKSLALDPEVRYASAAEMADAIREAVESGVAPEVTAATNVLGGAAAAPPVEDRTNVLPADRTEPTRREPPRQVPANRPRRAAAAPPVAPPPARPLSRRERRAAAAAAPPAAPRRKRRFGPVKIFLLLLLLALIAAAVYAVMLVDDALQNAPELRDLVDDQLGQAVDEIERFIEQNTQR